MQVTKDKKLYMVEFGEPDTPGWSSFSGAPVFVLAKDYQEAAEKAHEYYQHKRQTKDSVVDLEGNLTAAAKQQKELKVKSVKIAAEELVY